MTGPQSTALPAVAPKSKRPIPTLGVEEEYLFVDPVSRAAVPGAKTVLRRMGDRFGNLVVPEFTQFQIEARTNPCVDVRELDAQLRELRSAVAESARDEGLRLVAVGSPIIGDVVPPPITEGERYRDSDRFYRSLNDEQSVCACHVHVHLPEKERALWVSNHLRPWLPALIAMTANSPYWAGRDTGYASWRVLSRNRWPVAGPPPYFESLDHFEDLIGTLLTSGVMMDRGMIYWDVRPSAHVPTLEVRIADMPTTVWETVLLATVTRALIMVSIEAVERGERGPRISTELLRAACWRSARDGLAGEGIDVRTGRLQPATALLESLFAHVRPALEDCGELHLVSTGYKQLLAEGCGATRQQAIHAREGELTSVVDSLIESTA
ncbi:glutamate--cysteine ligase [Actinophytocola sp.]|uniref:carboxylate-amine ligase n=1 Tax=Actinophytocola sp. TaxID=1872138 RepID=UPI003899FFC6